MSIQPCALPENLLFIAGEWRKGRGAPIESRFSADGSLNRVIDGASREDGIAAIAAAVYLWVARQWESSRADELETQYTRMPTPSLRRDGPHAKRPHLKLDSGAARPRATSVEAQPQVSGDESVADLGEPQSAAVDIDEILRKLHRQGRGALSSGEQQALLSASRQLQEKRSLGQ